MDFNHYPNWNPFIKSISGAKVVGSNLSVQIQPPNAKGMAFDPEVLVLQPNAEFRWLGKLFIKGIFDGEHYFKLEKQDDGTTQFIHGEQFSGFLVALMGKALDKTEEGFVLMNQSLKVECERK